MDLTSTAQNGIPAVIERRRSETNRTYRNLADEALIPLTTLHRRLKGDGFTVAELQRIAAVFDVTPSTLMAEAEDLCREGAG